jgi:hypothetical protein
MDDAERRIQEMKIDEAIGWHENKVIEIVARYGGDGHFAPGELGDQAIDRVNGELYRMVRTAAGIDV